MNQMQPCVNVVPEGEQVYHPATSLALRVLIVVDELATTNLLTRFLRALGYGVDQAVGPTQLIASLRCSRPDFIIAGVNRSSPTFARLCEEVAKSDEYIHLFLMVDDSQPHVVRDSLDAGVSDFLRSPIVFGEVVARLRAGARVLEYERRVSLRQHVDPWTGLTGRAALARFLKRWLQPIDGAQPNVSCVACNVDFFGGLVNELGRTAAGQALAEVAMAMAEYVRKSDRLFAGGVDQFFIGLLGTTEAEAAAWAENVRVGLSECTLQAGETTVQVTASLGVAGNNGQIVEAETLIQRALEAQQSAKRSGRNNVVSNSRLPNEQSSWATVIGPGKLFERTTAKDIMIPCVAVLASDDTIGSAADSLRQTGLPAVIVADATGKYVGYVTDTEVKERSRDQPRLGDVVLDDAPCFEEISKFVHLTQFFSQDDRSLIIIVRDGRPTGMVTRSGCAALSSPVDKSSFVPAIPDAGTSDYLRVHDTTSMDQL